MVEALLGHYVEARKIAGAAVALRRDRGAAQFISRGAIALDGAAADTRSLWRIFSMTKPVTGVAAMSLIERRRMGLESPVADFVPEFANLRVIDGATTRPARTVMRVRHLLTHTAGLGYVINEGSPLAPLYRDAVLVPGDPTPREGGPQSLDEFGARLATLPLGSDPGTRYEYSVALDLLGLVIQRASGMPFADYLRTALFEPLGMQDTGFSVPAPARSRLAQNYLVRDGRIEPLERTGQSPYFAAPAYPSGGGGLISSAGDYDRFCAMLMNDGVLDGVRVLSAPTARKAHANLLPRGVSADGLNFGAGMGIVATERGEAGEARGTYFWGGAAGTFMWMDPRTRLSAVLMTQFMPSRAWPLWREFREAAYADLSAA